MKAMMMSLMVMVMALVGGGDEEKHSRVKIVKKYGTEGTTIIMERTDDEPATLNINGTEIDINLEELEIGETRLLDLEDGEQAEITREEDGYTLVTDDDEPVRLIYVDGDFDFHHGEHEDGDHVVFVDGEHVTVNGEDLAETITLRVNKALEGLHDSGVFVFNTDDDAKVEFKTLEDLEGLEEHLEGLEERIQVRVEKAMKHVEVIEGEMEKHFEIDVDVDTEGEGHVMQWVDENGDVHTGFKKMKFISVDTEEVEGEDGKIKKKFIIKSHKPVIEEKKEDQ